MIKHIVFSKDQTEAIEHIDLLTQGKQVEIIRNSRHEYKIECEGELYWWAYPSDSSRGQKAHYAYAKKEDLEGDKFCYSRLMGVVVPASMLYEKREEFKYKNHIVFY